MTSEGAKATSSPIYGIGGGVSDSPLAMSLFDGFINCKPDKGTSTKWGDKNNLKSLCDCKSPWVGGVISVGFFCVDFDNKKDWNLAIEILRKEAEEGRPIECVAIESENGGHLYFATDGVKRIGNTDNVCALGLGCNNDDPDKGFVGEHDYRIGGENYCIVKSNGKERSIVYQSPTGKLGPIPPWLELYRPNKFKSVEDILPIKRLGKDEGRNDILYRWYSFLRIGLEYSEEDARETCRIINWGVFKVPLPEDEFKTATREERDWGKAKAYLGGNKGAGNNDGTDIEIVKGTPAEDVIDSLTTAEKKPKKWEKVEIYLFKNYIFACINGACYIWVAGKGIYALLTHDVIDDLVGDAFDGAIKLTDQELRNVKRQLYSDVRRTCPKLELAQGIVPFADCDYDLRTGECHEFTPERVVLSRLPHNKPTCTEAPQFVLDSIDDWADADEETKILLVQIIAFCLTGQLASIQQCILLLGDACNGKTVFTHLLEHIVGAENCAHLSMKDLSERFRTAELVGKRLNCCDELTPKYIEETDKFKQLSGQGAITVEKKGKDPVAYLYDGVMVFSANDMPRLKDDTGAVRRRLCFCAFTHTFKKNDQFVRELFKPENIEGYIYLGLKAARILYNGGGGFIEPEKSKALYKEFEQLADPLGVWVDELDVDRDIIGNKPQDVYDHYSYCIRRNGGKPMGSRQFSNLLIKRFGVKSTPRKKENSLDGRTEREYEYITPKQ